MNIKSRIEAAKYLIEKGMHSDALILVLIAVAASARKVYPKNGGTLDGVAFEKFLNNTIGSFAMKFSLSGKPRVEHTIGELVYKQYRCSLLHEGELSSDAQFVASVDPSQKYFVSLTIEHDKSADFAISQNNEIIMSYDFLPLLIKKVEEAKCNEDLYGPQPPSDGKPSITIDGIMVDNDFDSD